MRWRVANSRACRARSVAGDQRGDRVDGSLVGHQSFNIVASSAGLPPDHVGGLLGDHQHRGVEVGGGHGRHDRGIDHAQALEPAHAQLVVDDRGRIAVRRHAAGAHQMERRGAALLGGLQQLGIRLLLRAGEFLAVVVFAEGLEPSSRRAGFMPASKTRRSPSAAG